MLLIWITATLAACDGPQTFRIKGTMDSNTNINLYVRYYGNGAVQTGISPVRDGKFEAEFSSVDPTLVELRDNDNRLLGMAFAKNGDVIDMEIDRRNPYLIKLAGTETNVQLAEALNANADIFASNDPTKVNQAIEDYIAGNPTSIVGALLFNALYDASHDPLRADSVLSMIDPEARLASVLEAYVWQLRPFTDPLSYKEVKDIAYRERSNDSIIHFKVSDKALSLLVFSNENSWRADSVRPHLRRISKSYSNNKLQILDLGIFSETSSWKGITSRDSADWIQGWAPGGILGEAAHRLAIPSVPYYIVTDSTGRQLYRGKSAYDAEAIIKEKL